MVGFTISHYRITAELGRGGMGIVYRATDTKLDRTVALKVLPPHALSSEDDRARFYREAKAAAQLHHPRIATVFQIDEAVLVEDGREPAPDAEKRPFIAMEFVDGDTLSERISEGPMKLDEAVRVATQVAEALGAAHEAGIVHRDVKSGNVMLTRKGEVKVLDFGLAKTSASTQLTRQGSTLGTVAYMSPEQARGEDVDARTDLWALGVVLYEMIAGRLPFAADYEQAALYGILNEDAEPLTAVRADVPMGLDWIVAKLLAKPTADRYQTATDLAVDLRTVDLASSSMSRTASTTLAPLRSGARPARGDMRGGRTPLHVAVVVVLVVIAAWLGWLLGPTGGQELAPGTVKRLTQSVPLGGVVAAMDISDDGSLVAMATQTIHVLDLSRGEMRQYDAPEVYVHLAFSPDGDRLLLTTASAIKILTLDSGSIIEVSKTTEGGPRAEWIDSETIIYEDIPSIYERSLTTGAVRRVIELDTLIGQFDMDFPMILPNGETVVATAQARDVPDRIGFWDLQSGENLGYIDLPGHRVQYLDSGHLVFIQDGDLVAMPFDSERLAQTGPLIPLVRDVRFEGMSVSREGTLAHVGSQVGIVSNARPTRPVVVRMTGASFANDFPQDTYPAAVYRDAAVHPSGSIAAVTVDGDQADGDAPVTDIWILDFGTGSRRALTTGGVSRDPAWSTSGDSLYFIRRSDLRNDLVVKSTARQGGETVLRSTASFRVADLAISPDGRQAVVAVGVPGSMDASSRYILFNPREPKDDFYDRADRLLDGPGGNPRQFSFSPDGRYLAYEDQGGIYVQAADDPDSAPSMIWENGMTLPRWSPDGRTLYALDVVSGGESVPVQLEPTFAVSGAPTDHTSQWFAFGTGLFDTFPDSDRFLFGIPETTSESVSEVDLTEELDLYLIVNLTSELSAVR